MHFENYMKDDVVLANSKLVPLLLEKLETLDDEYHCLSSESIRRAVEVDVRLFHYV
jgi:hypothetical protein